MKHLQIPLVTSRLSWAILAACSVLVLLGRSAVTEILPAGNTGNAATAVSEILAKTTKVRIDYAGNLSVVVADAKWLEQFKSLLVRAKYKPASYCFCINTPTFTLLAGDNELVRFEVPHGDKIRFERSKVLHGDFDVGKEIGEALFTLTREKQSLAVAQGSLVPSKPKLPSQIELKP